MAAVSDLVYRKLHNENFRKLIGKFVECDLNRGPWVAGGSVRKVWFDIPWEDQDVDFFFPNQQSFNRFSATMHGRFKTDDGYFSPGTIRGVLTSLSDLFSDQKHHIEMFSTENADTWKMSGDEGWKIQAIRKEYPGSVNELFNGFDFTICQFATDGETMVATRAAIEDCERKVFNLSSDQPGAMSMARIAKYSAYGFSPDDDLMTSMLKSFNNDEPMGAWDAY